MTPPLVTPRAEILVVDPDAGVRDVCASMLEVLGYHAETEECDGLAVASVTRRPVDVVLLDVEVARQRTTELMRALKRERPALRVLVMSGLPSRDLNVFLAGGADGVLRKPFRLAELDARVAACVAAD